MAETKKTAAYFIAGFTAVLTAVNLIIYLMHISDRIYAPVVALMGLTILSLVVYMVKPVRYLEYLPVVSYLAAMYFYYTTEASYISVCYLAVDASFTPEYLFQIGLTLFIGVIVVLLPIFAGGKAEK